MTRSQIAGMTNFNSTRTSVITETIQFDAGINNIALPLTTSDNGNFSVSLRGKRRTTNVAGVYTGTEVQIKAFRDELEAEANSSSQQEKTYTVSDGGTYDVIISNFTSKRDLTSAEQVTFSIDLITSNQIL